MKTNRRTTIKNDNKNENRNFDWRILTNKQKSKTNFDPFSC